MKVNDAVFGAVFLALSLLVLWTIQGYPKIPGQNVGPAAFPGVVAGLLALCSLLLIVQGVRARDAVAVDRARRVDAPAAATGGLRRHGRRLAAVRRRGATRSAS